MTVAIQSSRVENTATAGQTVFPYPFSIDDVGELQVIRSYLAQTLGLHYTVSGVGAPNGGNVTFAAGLAANETVILRRVLPLSQPSDYQPNHPFPAELHEHDHDRLVKIAQQLLDLIELTTETGLVGDVIPSSAFAAPPPLMPGRLRRLTDRARGVWMATGTAWFSLAGEIVNVKEFGAVGDGIIDDTAAIQAAFNAVPDGGMLYLPAGCYRTTVAIQVTHGCVVRGAGAASIGDIEASVISGTQINVSTAGQTAFAVNTRGKVVFEHLTIDNPMGLANTTGISATGPDESLSGALFPTLFHVSIWALAIGFDVSKGIFTEVDGCMFWNTTQIAVQRPM